MRRLHPARADRSPLYVQTSRARIGLDGPQLIGITAEGQKAEAQLPDTSQVAVGGNVQISTQAIRALMERGIPVSFLTNGGRLVGRASGFDSNNVALKVAEHRAAADPSSCLQLARRLVASKIRNSRTLLGRNHPEPPAQVLRAS